MVRSRPVRDVFPARLRAAREKQGWTQDELARRAKLPPSAISHFETGSRKPSFANLRRLADALEVNTDYLLGRTDKPEGMSESVDELYRDLQNASEADREFVRSVLKAQQERKTKGS